MKKRTVLFGIILLLAGGLIGFSWANYLNNSVTDNSDNLEFHSGGYEFINPLYECRNKEMGITEFNGFESNYDDIINDYISSGKIASGSIYFRDLNNGPWFGVNEKVDFSPSSLLKLPVMMAFYKKSESDPSILSKLIKYDKDPNGVLYQNYPPSNPLQKGNSYTIEQLIEHMVMRSDNEALGLLEENISRAQIDKVTLDLGIPTATNSTPEDYMNVKDYSALFRILFNASYLSKEMSEKALQNLSKSDFNTGLRKEVPQNIPIAHKFGERQLPGGTNQLHDCGIIYYPKHPYLLCIMTRGNDFSSLENVIQDISGQVYKDVDLRFKKNNK
jgi:beta-lactamase class A